MFVQVQVQKGLQGPSSKRFLPSSGGNCETQPRRAFQEAPSRCFPKPRHCRVYTHRSADQLLRVSVDSSGQGGGDLC